MKNKNEEYNTFLKDREILHKQLELLAENSKSGSCSYSDLAEISKQMVAIYSALHNPCC